MKKCELRQSAILEYMKQIISEKGFPPTIREICQALDIKSTSTVHKDLEILEASGLVTKDPTKPRTIYPTEMLPINKRNAAAANSSEYFPSNDNLISDSNMVSLPVIGRVAAGTPILSEENVEDVIPMPARFVGPGNNFILTVHGESMIQAGINDGDFIIVQECLEAKNGDIVVAMINNEFDCESTVKRFFKENGHIRLQPENDSMEPIIVDDCKIIGKVKGVFRYLN